LNPNCRLLAVDVGLRTAMAGFDQNGRVVFLQSRHFRSSTVLRKAVPGLLAEFSQLEHVVLEGGGELAKVWQKNLDRAGFAHSLVHADRWRKDMFYPREQRNGPIAKQAALDLFTSVISWSGLSGSFSKQDDAAEAVLCGFWWAWQAGWVADAPVELQKRL